MTSATTNPHDSSGASPAGLAGHPTCTRVPPEDLRLALVLNGGVSLAVWMGGVAHEIDRLTKADRSGTGPYDLMLRLTGSRSRADIITGTSAGGINGAAIALAQVNREADLGMLRDLWTDQGRIDALLRPPFKGQPTSLLRGDEYFLPQLSSALGMLARPGPGWADEMEAPIDLTITTTVLRGNQAVSVDAMGQQLPQSMHAGLFRWQRYPPAARDRRAGRADGHDPFGRDTIEHTARQLALACRATASFPTAFEPCFVPVGRAPADSAADDGLRPDMASVVRSWGTKGAGTDRSRYVVDGGLLANTPTKAALNAIAAMPDDGPVRRVMLLVFPHAPVPGDDPPDTLDEPPTLASAMSSMMGALAAQGSRTHIEELERHNLAVAGRRGTRSDVLHQLETPNDLEERARNVYPHYVLIRRWRAARDLAAWRTGSTTVDQVGSHNLPPEWSFERVRGAAESAQEQWIDGADGTAHELPYAPGTHPLADNVDRAGWGWGVRGALGVADAIMDLLRRLVWVVHGDEFETVAEVRHLVSDLTATLRHHREHVDRVWRASDTLTRLKPDQTYWTLRLACFDHLMLGSVDRDEIGRLIARVAERNEGAEGEGVPTADSIAAALEESLADGPASVGMSVRDVVDDLLGAVQRVLPLLTPDLVEGHVELRRWRAVLFPEGDPTRLRSPLLLARLLQLEVVSTTLGDEVTTGATQPIETVQISAQTANPFATHTRTADGKLGGDVMARFGGFLKRSWRVNDWIWGRADAATVLSTMLLDPERIRRTARLSGYVTVTTTPEEAARLARETVDGVVALLPQLPADEVSRLEPGAIDQLTKVFDLQVSDGDLPSALPDLAALFAWALHLDAVPGELPALARAVRADRVDGANGRSRSEVFLEEYRDLLGRLDAVRDAPGDLSPADRLRALRAFDRAGIGREPLRDEATSDLLIRTSASAAAVVTTVADSDRSGLGAIKPVTRVLRGGMLLPYWAIWGLTSKSPLARTLAVLAFAVGGVLLALSLFGVFPESLSAPGAALGAGTVLAGFAYGAARTGSLLHSIVLLTPLIPLAVYAFERSDAAGGAARERGLTGFVVVVLLAVTLMLLGSIRTMTGTVWAALDGLADTVRVPGTWARTVRRALGVALLVIGFALGILLLAGSVWAIRWSVGDTPAGFVKEHRLASYVAAVVLVVIAAVVADRCGGWLKVLRRHEDGSWRYAPLTHAKATAAGWSVLYGVGYLLIAVGVTLMPQLENWLWARAVFATATAFALVLLVVVPVYLPWSAVRDFVRDEKRRAAENAHLAEPPDYLDDLGARGVLYRRFVTQGRDDQRQLTRRGRRLEQDVREARRSARADERHAAAH